MLYWHSFVGVAPGEVAQSRGDGVGSGSKSAQALQTAIKTRVVSTGRRGGPSWTTPAAGETPERRLWAVQGEDRRACPAHLMVHSPIAFHSGGLGRSKKPCIQELLPPAL